MNNTTYCSVESGGGSCDHCTCFEEERNSTNVFCHGFEGVSYIYLSLSSLSLVCCLTVVVTYILFPRLSAYSSKAFIYRTLLDLVIAITHILSPVASLKSSMLGCHILGLVVHFCLVGANLWYGYLVLDLFRAIRNPFGTHPRSGIRSVILVLIISTGFTVLLELSRFDDVGPGISMFYFCWINVVDVNVVQFASWSLFLYYGPHFLLWLCSFGVFFLSSCLLFRRHLPASSETRSRIMKQNTIYVLVLGIESTLILPIWIIQLFFTATTDPGAKFCFQTIRSSVLAGIFAFVHSLRGTVDLIVWWVSFSIGPKDVYKLYQNIRARTTRRNLYLPHDSLNTPLVQQEDNKINQALRRDVVYCINYGILDAVKVSADDAKQRTRLGSVRDEFMAQIMVQWGEQNHQQQTQEKHADPYYEGESHSRRIVFRPSRDLIDFTFVDMEPTVFGLLRNSFGVDATEYQQSFRIPDEQDVESSGMLEKFTEGKSGSFFYFTRDFRYIIKTVTPGEERFLQRIAYRYYKYMSDHQDSVIVRLFGLHKVRLARGQHYIRVLVMDNLFYNEQRLRMHERYDLKGSTVGRRVLKGKESLPSKKTMKDLDLKKGIKIGREAKAQLMEQLRKDVAFLSSLKIMDYSLLLGIHGHSHDNRRSGPIEKEGGDDFTVVDMTQSLTLRPRDLNLTGSPAGTLERGAALAQHRATELTPVSDNPAFVESIEGVGQYVPWHRRDYGGLRSYTPNHPLNRDSCFSDLEGGISFDANPPATYFFGIVDILQEYDFQKKLEHMFKTRVLCKDKHAISAINEKDYATRFIDAMDRYFE